MLFINLFTLSEIESTSQVEEVTNNSVSWVDTIMKYSVLILIIFTSLVLISLLKRKYKKEASVKQFKNKCDKAINYALKIKNKTSKQDLLIAATKLGKLTSLINSATWIASRLMEEKQDVVLNDIYSSMDSLSIFVGNYSSEGFYSKDDYISKIEYVITEIKEVKERVEQYQKDN